MEWASGDSNYATCQQYLCNYPRDTLFVLNSLCLWRQPQSVWTQQTAYKSNAAQNYSSVSGLASGYLITLLCQCCQHHLNKTTWIFIHFKSTDIVSDHFWSTGVRGCCSTDHSGVSHYRLSHHTITSGTVKLLRLAGDGGQRWIMDDKYYQLMKSCTWVMAYF